MQQPESASDPGAAAVNAIPPNAWKSAWPRFTDSDGPLHSGRGDTRFLAALQRRLPARRHMAPTAGAKTELGLAARSAAAPAPLFDPGVHLRKEAVHVDIDRLPEPSTDDMVVATGVDFGVGVTGPLIAARPAVPIPDSPHGTSRGSAAIDRTRRGTSWPVNRRVDNVLGEVAGEEAVTLRSDKAIRAIEATSDARQRTASAFPRQALVVLALLMMGLLLVMLPLNQADDASTKPSPQRAQKSR